MNSEIFRPLSRHATIGAGLALLFASSTVQAQVVHADDVRIEQNTPSLTFDDTDFLNDEWSFLGRAEYFRLVDQAFGNNVFDLAPGTDSINTLVLASDGGLSLADDVLSISRDPSQVLINGPGGTLPSLILDGVTTTLRMQSGGVRQFDLRASNDFFAINDDDGFSTLVIAQEAPPSSLFIDATGAVGLGLSTPAAALHVENDTDVRVLVENTSVVSAPRTLFELQNSGNTKFEIVNLKAGKSWAFTNNGDDFRISRQDSGVVEFKFFDTGNLLIAGMLTENSDRDAKQDIQSVDRQYVLDKVMDLPISEWSYTDTPGERHIGPMAQDFHAAFRLGATDKGIASLDAVGVAMASIQALAEQNRALAADNRALRAEVQELKALVMQVLPQVAQN